MKDVNIVKVHRSCVAAILAIFFAGAALSSQGTGAEKEKRDDDTALTARRDGVIVVPKMDTTTVRPTELLRRIGRER